jgi:hypothetical protein
MDFLQCCQLCHHSNRPQPGLRRLGVEDLYPPTQLQLVQSVRLHPHYLVGHKEEGLEDPTLRDLRSVPCHV